MAKLLVRDKDSILGLTTIMFNLAPDADIYNDLVASYEAHGNSLFGLAADLEATGAFQAKINGKTNEQIADYLLENLKLDATTVAGQAAKNYFVDRLNDGASVGDIAAEAVLYLLDDNRRKDAFDDTAEILKNKIEVASYFVDSGFDAQHLSDLDIIDDVISNADVASALDQIDALSQNHEFVLTPGIDSLSLTKGDDTITGESATLGVSDTIIDPSASDNDTMNLKLNANMPAVNIDNVENINIKLDTLSQLAINAGNVHGATMTVGSDKTGFIGSVTVNNLNDNNLVAGNQINTLNVWGVKAGTIDTGSASTLNVTTATAADSINLKVNGNMALNAFANYNNLNIEATQDAVVDITGSLNTFNGTGTASGDGDLTIRTTSAFITGQTFNNNGEGELGIRLTNDANTNISRVAADKLIMEQTFTNTVTFSGDLDATAMQNANTMTFAGVAANNAGGSTGANVDLHLTQAANNDQYIFNNVNSARVDAQNGGTINTIAGSNTIRINAGQDLTVTTIVDPVNFIPNDTIILEPDSAGDIVFVGVDAAAINGSGFTHDFTMTQSNDTPISILGGSGVNSITLAAALNNASVVTQDGNDTINANSILSGRLTIDAAGGNDTVNATGMSTSVANIDLGAGNDTATVANSAATGNLTLSAGEGNDTININPGSAGQMTISGDAGNDTVDARALGNTANVSIDAGDGDDVVLLNQTAGSSPTISINGGAGTDTVRVSANADFTGSTLSFTDVDKLSLNGPATFTDRQLTDQTFEVLSGSSNTDQLNVVYTSLATDSHHTMNLGDLNVSSNSNSALEYVSINATAGASNDDTIIGAHHAANVIVLDTAAGNKDTIQLFADSLGTTVTNLGGAGNGDITSNDLITINTANVAFDIGVISNFNSSDDFLALGGGATANNYAEVAVNFNNDAGNPNAGIEEYLGDAATANTAIKAANDAIANAPASANIQFVYVYDNDTSGSAVSDAWLLWDTDDDNLVDAAILLVGIETAGDGSGFDSANIIAAS